jgi:hypothetical protein
MQNAIFGSPDVHRTDAPTQVQNILVATPRELYLHGIWQNLFLQKQHGGSGPEIEEVAFNILLDCVSQETGDVPAVPDIVHGAAAMYHLQASHWASCLPLNAYQQTRQCALHQALQPLMNDTQALPSSTRGDNQGIALRCTCPLMAAPS